MSSTIRKLAVAALLLWPVPASGHAAAVEEKLLVFAAASLQESMDAAAEAFSARGEARPLLSFAASSVLARQIENGAPAAVFVSADEQWMDYLADRDLLVSGTRASFLGNRLVLVAPADRPFETTIRPGFALGSLLGDEKLAMADPDAVPAGRYGKAALVNLGVWEQVEGRVVRTADVRAALALVERDECRAGIVYATDAMASNKVKVAGVFPEPGHPAVSYPLAIVAGHDGPLARRFRDFLLSKEGRAIFQRFGFLPK